MKIFILLLVLPLAILNANTDSVKSFIKNYGYYVQNNLWLEIAKMYREGDLEYYKTTMQKVFNSDLEFRNGFIEMGFNLSEMESLSPVHYYAKFMEITFSKLKDQDIKIDSVVVVGVMEGKQNQYNCIIETYLSREDKQSASKTIEEIIFENNNYYLMFDQEIRGKLEKISKYEYNDIYAINYDKNIESNILVTTCPDVEGETSYSSELAEIASINLVNGKITRLTKDLSKDSDPYWYPDKSKIFFTSKRPFKTYLAENGPDNIFYINMQNGQIINFSDSLRSLLEDNLGMDVRTPRWSNDKKLAFVSNEYGDDNLIQKLNIYIESENELLAIDTAYMISDFKWNHNGEYLFCESRDKNFDSKKYIYNYFGNSKIFIQDSLNTYDFIDWIPDSDVPMFQINDTLSTSIKLYKYNSKKNTFIEEKELKSINGKVKVILDQYKYLVLVEEVDFVYALYIYDSNTNTSKKIFESKKILEDISFTQ